MAQGKNLGKPDSLVWFDELRRESPGAVSLSGLSKDASPLKGIPSAKTPNVTSVYVLTKW